MPKIPDADAIVSAYVKLPESLNRRVRAYGVANGLNKSEAIARLLAERFNV